MNLSAIFTLVIFKSEIRIPTFLQGIYVAKNRVVLGITMLQRVWMYMSTFILDKPSIISTYRLDDANALTVDYNYFTNTVFSQITKNIKQIFKVCSNIRNNSIYMFILGHKGIGYLI